MVVIVYGGGCMLWYVVAVHGGDGHPCVAVFVLLYDCIRAWWLWSIYNE